MKINLFRVFVSFLLMYSVVSFAQTKSYSWTNLPKIAQPVFKRDTFNIANYGAKPDGITLNTAIINHTINLCSAKGGGVVYIPHGLWLSGPIVLKSNVNLCLNHAAILQFTKDKTKYLLVAGNYEGHPSPRNQSPISGIDLVNIAITGEGVIDGFGDVWRAMAKDYLTDREWNLLVTSGGVVSDDGRSWFPSRSYLKGLTTKDAIILQPGKSLKEYEPMKDFYRPNMVVLTNCKKVLLQNTTFENSPAWCLHTLLCEDLTLSNVKVLNPWNAQNGDGIDVESCRNILIEGSTFNAGDDGICVKSGRDEEGRKRAKPTENMIVKNNVVYRAHGGFVIGSEMSGGARNIFVSDCAFIGTDIGLRFKTTRGRGGVVEKIYIKNIIMKDILGNAILFDMYYGGKSLFTGDGTPVADTTKYPLNEGTPQFKDFYVSNVICNGAAGGLLIRGLPEQAIKGIHLDNVQLRVNKGVEISEATDITLKNVSVESNAPEAVISINNSEDVKLDHLSYANGADLLFSVTGAKSAQIQVTGTDITKVANKVTFKSGAHENALIIK